MSIKSDAIYCKFSARLSICSDFFLAIDVKICYVCTIFVLNFSFHIYSEIHLKKQFSSTFESKTLMRRKPQVQFPRLGQNATFKRKIHILRSYV